MKFGKRRSYKTLRRRLNLWKYPNDRITLSGHIAVGAEVRALPNAILIHLFTTNSIIIIIIIINNPCVIG